jgi:hypothetical protein
VTTLVKLHLRTVDYFRLVGRCYLLRVKTLLARVRVNIYAEVEGGMGIEPPSSLHIAKKWLQPG